MEAKEVKKLIRLKYIFDVLHGKSAGAGLIQMQVRMVNRLTT